MVKPSNSASNESSDGTLQNVLMNTYSICSSSKEMAAIGKYAAEHKVAVADRFYQNFCKGALGSKRKWCLYLEKQIHRRILGRITKEEKGRTRKLIRSIYVVSSKCSSKQENRSASNTGR